MAELDAQLRFDIDQALRDINEIERALDRAIAPIEIEVDTRQTQELESTLREVERIAARASTETASIDLAAGRAEANFEDLARALGISEAAARDLTTEVLQAQSAANRLEDATRDVARQLGLSDREAERLAGSLREADRAADAIDVTSIGLAGRFAALRTSAAAITGALAGIGGGVALGAAIVGANAAIQSFARLEDSINAVNVVFSDAAGAVLRFGETAAASAGLSQEAFNQAVVPIGSLLQNFGFDAQQAADGAVVLVQRAADLASVMGGTVQDALLAVGAALRGEADPLERYGASISAARVESFALAEGLAQTVADITPAITLQARYGLILQDTAKVSGDFAATSGDLANAQRTAGASVQNFVSDIGEKLAPALESILVLLPEVLEGVRQLVPGFAAGGDSVAAFFESVGEGGGFRTEFAAVQAGFQAITAGGGIAVDAVQGLASVFQGDLATAFRQFQALGGGVEEAFTGVIGVQFANDLDRGVEAVTAFGTAIGRTAQQSGSFDVFADSYRGFSTAANLSIPQLRTVTAELIKNANALGLTGPEVKFLREQLALLTNTLDPNIEALRQQQFVLSQVPEVVGGIVTPLDNLQGAADAAGVSLSELALSGDPLASDLFAALDPADQLAIRLDAVADGSVSLADAFTADLAPSLIDINDALQDLNEDGNVSLDEFITGLETTFTAASNFRENMLRILRISPEAFAELLKLPQDVAAAQLEAAVSTGREQELANALVGDPQTLADEMSDTVFQAVQIFRTQGPDAAEDFILGAAVLIDDEETGRQLIADARAGIERSRTDMGNLIEGFFAQDDAANRGAGITADAYEQTLNERFGVGNLNVPVEDVILDLFTQDDAANTAAGLTGDAYEQGLIDKFGLGSFLSEVDLADQVGAAFASDDVLTAALLAGQAARSAFWTGANAEISGETGQLSQTIGSTLAGAIGWESPPKLFLEAGAASGDAFWSAFEQSDLQVRTPTPAFSGSIATSTGQVGAGVGGGGDVIFNLPALDTRDADVTIARAGQIGGQVVGILNGRFHL